MADGTMSVTAVPKSPLHPWSDCSVRLFYGDFDGTLTEVGREDNVVVYGVGAGTTRLVKTRITNTASGAYTDYDVKVFCTPVNPINT